jgi:hypothetical protein
MKLLIFGGAHVDSEAKLAEVSLWADVVCKLNPGVDIVFYDTASTPAVSLRKEITVERFDYNPGHLSHGGGDGWGRTFCEGIERAIYDGYDYVCYWERDFIIAKEIYYIVGRMRRANVKAAHLFLANYQFTENAFGVYRVDFLEEIDFVKQYDWRSRKPIPQTYSHPSELREHTPEWRVHDIIGENLWILPYPGIRNDKNQVNFMNLHDMCPYEPPTWLHMGQDIRLFHRFLELNGIALP